MDDQKLSREEKTFARVSVNELLVYLASNYNPNEVMEIAESCGFDLDSALATWRLAKDLSQHGKEYFDRRLVYWRNIYYRNNELKYKCSPKIQYKSFLKRLTLFGYSYQLTAIKSVEILERFAGGKLLIGSADEVVLSKNNSFLDYIKSNKCYMEKLTLYFENIPELIFSLSFRDNTEERFNSFACFICAHSIDEEFYASGSIRLNCQKREYYDVSEYFNNRFMRFMSCAILTAFFSDQRKDSIAFYLCEYLKTKGFILPDLQYCFIAYNNEAQTEIEKMIKDSSESIKDLDSLLKRVIKIEAKRGVLPQHLTFLKLYLRSFVLEQKTHLNEWANKDNLRDLETKYQNSLK